MDPNLLGLRHLTYEASRALESAILPEMGNLILVLLSSEKVYHCKKIRDIEEVRKPVSGNDTSQ